ncbi:N-acetylmuramoyl-L-alanine amidase [Rouxiella sp. Mn2063]|uniref:N-acetylmuramoyl-L-alanine amidase n=1 Tax=Rouxiella sp. Mn2063 TaxID=3395262 RepID=UPI003BD2153D
MYQIDYNSYRSVKGFNRRVRFLVMHYTAVNFAQSTTLLAGDGGASAHYLVPDPTEQSYLEAGFKELRLFNLVDENDRAWHAGVSSWDGRTNLNDSSLGIEIVNLASEDNGVFTFPPYHHEQIAAIKQLALNIIQRYPDLSPTNVVAHSDISPYRKSDPGPAFPWKELYEAGIGAWYDNATKDKYAEKFLSALPAKKDIISNLQKYGYDVSAATTDTGYKQLIRAFQLHYRQCDYSGVIDVETAAILYALVEKYKS